MYTYSITQWIMFSFIYCFFGWCIESAIVSYKEERLVNRGFLKLPLLPIYGCGAITILIYTIPVKASPVLVYILGALGATVLEYVTGWGMEKLFKVRYWDYTGKFMNFNGHICLECTLFWGVLACFLTYMVHSPIEKFVLGLSKLTLYIVVIIISVLFVIDFCISLKAAIDLAKYISKLYELRGQIEYAKDELEQYVARSIEEKSQDAKDTIEAAKRKYEKEMDMRIALLLQEKENIQSKMNYMTRVLVSAHPSITAPKFAGVVEDIKIYLKDRKKK